MVWIPDGEKNLKISLFRFDIMHERDRHTHRHSIAQQKLLLLLHLLLLTSIIYNNNNNIIIIIPLTQ